MNKETVVQRITRYLIEEKDLGPGWFAYFYYYAQILVDKQKAVIL